MVSGTQSPHEAVSCYSLNLGVAIGAIKQKYHYKDATIERHSSSPKKTWCQYLHPHIIRHVTLRNSPGLPASFLAQNSPPWPQLLLLQMILSASLANQGLPQRICLGISPKQPPGGATNKESFIYIYKYNISAEKYLKRKNNVEFFHGKPGQKDVNMDLESWSISSASW